PRPALLARSSAGAKCAPTPPGKAPGKFRCSWLPPQAVGQSAPDLLELRIDGGVQIPAVGFKNHRTGLARRVGKDLHSRPGGMLFEACLYQCGVCGMDAHA